MKRDKNDIRSILARYLSRYGEPSQEDADSAVGDVWQRLQPEAARAQNGVAPSREARPRWRFAAVAAAAAVLVLVGVLQFPREIDAFVAVDAADGKLSLISGNKTQVAEIGDKVEAGEILRSDDGRGGIALADGSRVEMREQSELSWDRYQDGTRIQLFKGSVIVNAADTTRVYVQTKERLVSGMNSVFLVVAEEAGTRVAGIGGEVLVEVPGRATWRPGPGQQVSTNPGLPTLNIEEQIAWSRNAAVYMALLQQSTGAPAPVEPKRLVFEVATLRVGPGEPLIRCKGADGIWASNYRIDDAARAVPLGRCIGTLGLGTHIRSLYDIRVDGEPSTQFLSGTEREPFQQLYQLEAKAENPASVTKAELQEMLRNLVIDRFKLKIRREERGTETGYALFVAAGGTKFKETSGDEDGTWGRPPGGCRPPCPILISGKFTMKRFARYMGTTWTGNGMIVDKTGLTGIYDLSLTLNPVPQLPRESTGGPRGGGGNAGGPSREYNPPLPKAMEDQLGLRLEWGHPVPVERWIIEHIEMPSEN